MTGSPTRSQRATGIVAVVVAIAIAVVSVVNVADTISKWRDVDNCP